MGRPPIRSGFDCYHCGSGDTSKAGQDKGKQRFYCRGCRKFFREKPVVPPGNADRRRSARSNLPSQAELVAELRSIVQELKTTPTTTIIARFSKEGRSHSLNTYYAVFGSFPEALRRAKIKRIYIREFDADDRERMLRELRILRRKLGRPIFNEDVVKARQNDKTLTPPNHLRLAFGSVPKAIEAAGVGRKKYSRDEMVEFLRNLDNKLGRAVRKDDVQEQFRLNQGPSIKSIVKEFGGLRDARRVARVRTL